MAAIRDVEVEAIEAARKSVIELALAHQTTARVARKQAVKELFGTLLGAWEAGVPFDKMAEALKASGIQITPETLRSYFFELKTAEQLRAQNAEHVRAMTKLRAENESRQRSRDLLHARELAQAGTELVSSTREAKVEAAHQVASQAVQAARRRPIGAPSSPSVAGRAEPAGDLGGVGSQNPRPGRGTAARGVPNVGNVAAPVSEPSAPAVVALKAPSAPLPEPAPALPNSSQAGQAKSLDEIARTSQGQKETTYVENLVLKEGNTVWYESGKPFEGFLSPRTLHTLRNVGRVIAPTEGRTAKDFVQMDHEL